MRCARFKIEKSSGEPKLSEATLNERVLATLEVVELMTATADAAELSHAIMNLCPCKRSAQCLRATTIVKRSRALIGRVEGEM